MRNMLAGWVRELFGDGREWAVVTRAADRVYGAGRRDRANRAVAARILDSVAGPCRGRRTAGRGLVPVPEVSTGPRGGLVETHPPGSQQTGGKQPEYDYTTNAHEGSDPRTDVSAFNRTYAYRYALRAARRTANGTAAGAAPALTRDANASSSGHLDTTRGHRVDYQTVWDIVQTAFLRWHMGRARQTYTVRTRAGRVEQRFHTPVTTKQAVRNAVRSVLRTDGRVAAAQRRAARSGSVVRDQLRRAADALSDMLPIVPGLSNDVLTFILTRLASGDDRQTVAAELGVDPKTVTNWLRRVAAALPADAAREEYPTPVAYVSSRPAVGPLPYSPRRPAPGAPPIPSRRCLTSGTGYPVSDPPAGPRVPRPDGPDAPPVSMWPAVTYGLCADDGHPDTVQAAYGVCYGGSGI